LKASEKPSDHGRKRSGRPAGLNVTDIRAAILDSAESLFSARGYAATSLRQIADEVGVNPAMIHYYFGSKRALLQQVLERTLEPLANAIAGMKAAAQAPVEEITSLLLKTFGEHPGLPTLIVREVLLPGGLMQDHFLEFLAPRLGGSIPDLIEKEQLEGRISRDLDSHFCSLILLSLCAFPFIARELAEPALQISYDDSGRAKLEQHIRQLLNRGFSV
jgi:AcrR family transcriptional regulator